MTWSISFSAPNKAAAQVALTQKLPAAMLHQAPHARDFDMVKTFLSAAIEVCEEGTVSVSASGHVDTDWADPVPSITAVNLSSVSVRSTAGA
jgi:hypothetical protein